MFVAELKLKVVKIKNLNCFPNSNDYETKNQQNKCLCYFLTRKNHTKFSVPELRCWDNCFKPLSLKQSF